MVFIRGRHPDASMSQYFRGGADGFVFDERDGVCEARISANADRTVELFLALAEHLPPAVDVEIIDIRTGDSWRGEDLALVDARDAIARLKSLLATRAGVEFTIIGLDDQLTRALAQYLRDLHQGRLNPEELQHRFKAPPLSTFEP